jgi:hypothetical protein
MAKEIERAGIPTAYITTLTDLATMMQANRIVAGVQIPYPCGNPLLAPDQERELRRRLVLAALESVQRSVDGPQVVRAHLRAGSGSGSGAVEGATPAEPGRGPAGRLDAESTEG